VQPEDLGDIMKNVLTGAAGTAVPEKREAAQKDPQPHKPDSHTLGLWHFDGNGKDAAQYSNDGTLIGKSVWAGSKPGFGKNLYVAGRDGEYFEAKTAASLDGMDEFTAEIWVYPFDYQEEDYVLHKRNGCYWINVRAKRWCFGIGLSDNVRYTVKGNFIQIARWIHLALAYDGKSLRAYENGEEVGSIAIARSLSLKKDPKGSLLIGGDRDGHSIKAHLDDVRISDVARKSFPRRHQVSLKTEERPSFEPVKIKKKYPVEHTGPAELTVTELEREIRIVWLGGDGVLRKVVFDKWNKPGSITGMFIDNNGNRDFGDQKNRLPFAAPHYSAEINGVVYDSELDITEYRVERRGARVNLYFNSVKLGPIKGYLVYSFYNRSNLFSDEFRAGIDFLSSVSKLQHGLTGFPDAAENGRIPGLTMFIPPHYWYEGKPFFKKLEGGKGYAGCYLFAGTPYKRGPFSFEKGDEKRFRMLYHLYSKSSRPLAAYTNTESYRPLRGHKIFATHVHGDETTMQHQRDAGVDIVLMTNYAHALTASAERWQTELARCKTMSTDSFLVLPGSEFSLGSQLGEIKGHSNYLTPVPKLYRKMDDVAKAVSKDGGITWLNHPLSAGLFSPDFLVANWGSDLIGLEWNSRDEWHSKYGSFLYFNTDFQNEFFAMLDALLSAGHKVWVIGGSDVHGGTRDKAYIENMPNYVRLDNGDTENLLTALKNGRFFVTSGPILIRDFRLGDRRSGETFTGKGKGKIILDLEWTFPLREMRLVGSSGLLLKYVPLAADEHGSRKFQLDVDISGQQWIRAEAYDIANNPAFTQAIFIRKP